MIANYFIRLNSKTGVTNQIAKNYGIAYWNKTLQYQKGNTYLGRTGQDTAALIAYIPLVYGTNTTVKAQLTVKITTTDTIYNVLTTSQYANYDFQPTTDTAALNGLKVFTLFARHDHNIFGYHKFKIIDNRILLGQTNFAVHSNKTYVVELDTTTTTANARPISFAAPAPPPLPHSSCLIVKDYENQGYSVTYTMVGSACVVSSYGVNDNFIDDNNNNSSGGGGGGGGGGGSSTPPAWTPFVPPFDINNPCDVVDSLMKTNNFPTYYKKNLN